MSEALAHAADPVPNGSAEPGVTGEPLVDAATALLAGLGARRTADHPQVYEQVHQRLQDALAHAADGGARTVDVPVSGAQP